ncbi:winged helix-turn-helix domain-containing protein [Kitasatospora aburaviensis]
MFPNHAQPLVTAPAETSVLALLLTEGPLSRVELARRTGLSSTAVTKAARPLIDDGYLHELPGTHRPGRRTARQPAGRHRGPGVLRRGQDQRRGPLRHGLRPAGRHAGHRRPPAGRGPRPGGRVRPGRRTRRAPARRGPDVPGRTATSASRSPATSTAPPAGSATPSSPAGATSRSPGRWRGRPA